MSHHQVTKTYKQLFLASSTECLPEELQGSASELLWLAFSRICLEPLFTLSSSPGDETFVPILDMMSLSYFMTLNRAWFVSISFCLVSNSSHVCSQWNQDKYTVFLSFCVVFHVFFLCNDHHVGYSVCVLKDLCCSSGTSILSSRFHYIERCPRLSKNIRMPLTSVRVCLSNQTLLFSLFVPVSRRS